MPTYDPYLEEDIAPGFGSAVAFDVPTEGGLRFPLAAPMGGSWAPPYTPPAVTPEFSPNGGRYVPGSENAVALPGGGYNQAYAADELRSQQAGDPQAIQQAIRLQGLMKYRTLISGGMNPAEAIRQAAPELYFNHPVATVSAMRPQESMLPPNITEVPLTGGATAVLANGRYRTLNRLPVVKDLDAELNRTEGNERVTQAMRALNAAQKALLPDDALIKQRERELEEARQSRRASTRSGSSLTPTTAGKTLTKEIASELLRQAKGDKELARKLARDGGFKF